MTHEKGDVAKLRRGEAALEELVGEAGDSAGWAKAADRLRLLIEAAPDPTFCYQCDPPIPIDLPVAQQVERLYDCRLLECNEACARSYGADTAEEVVGRRLDELLDTSSGGFDQFFGRLIRADYQGVESEVVHILPDGAERHLLVTGRGVIENGQLFRVWGTFREVTDRELAEGALRDERELSDAALDALRETYFLFDATTGEAIRWNRAFRDVTGYSDEEIGALPAPASYYGSEDLERANAFIETLPDAGDGTIELDLLAKDGSKIPTEYSVSVIRNRGGGVRHVIAIGRDITDRRRADEEIRTQRERLQRFMDKATDSIHLVDADFGILEISESAAEALRAAFPDIRNRSDLIGSDFFELYPFLKGTEAERRFRGVIEKREPALFDDEVEHPVRGVVHLTVRAFMVGDDLGIVATDVSDLKHAAAEQLRLERHVQHNQKLESLGMLAGGIAHDFNNLLVGVVGGVDLALEHLPSSSPARSLLDGVIVAANRAAELADQMLAYSGKGRFLVEPVDLSTIVREMSQLVQTSAPKKIEIQYRLDDTLPATSLDITQVRQIVLNLVINGVEAIGTDAGTISLETGSLECDREDLDDMLLGDEAAEGTYTYFKVEDSGVGMDATTVGRIFDPFFSTKPGGRGLGLAAALGIVRSHSGAVRVDSGPSRGTAITVMFPAGTAMVHEVITQKGGDEDWSGSGLALVIDDEELVRSVAAEMLGVLGFEVLTAASGRDGLEIFNRHGDGIALVLLDLAMPDMSGDEVYRELRRTNRDVRVLLSSGFDEAEVSARVTSSAATDFIHKPYSLNALSNKIREVLGS